MASFGIEKNIIHEFILTFLIPVLTAGAHSEMLKVCRFIDVCTTKGTIFKRANVEILTAAYVFGKEKVNRRWFYKKIYGGHSSWDRRPAFFFDLRRMIRHT